MPLINFLKNKRYLTGIDWFVHTLDYMTKKETGTGNSSQIIMQLKGKPEKEAIRRCLAVVEKKYPVLSGIRKRAINLAPYWKIPSSEHTRQLSFDVKRVKEGAGINDVLLILEECVNKSFDNNREHLAFYLVEAGTKSYFAMTFDHRLFDARGAEAFMGLMMQAKLNKNDENKDEELSFAEPAHLNKWSKKFKAGKNVNRVFLNLAKKGRPNVLPLPRALKSSGFKFKLISFTREQSRLIVESANDSAGYLMLMPYLLTVSILIFQNIFTSRGIKTGDYVVPVAIDLRSPEKKIKDFFFNHMSFFMFLIDSEKADDFSSVLKSIKKQMYDQIKSGLPKDIREASYLMRIVPLPVLSRLIRLHLKGEIGSFCFSYVGETEYPFSEFMEKRVDNIFHMPRVPVPPGLGIFFHQFHGKLNAMLSYKEELLSYDEADTIIHSLSSMPEFK